MVLPEGFTVPPWQLLVPLVVLLAGVLASLWSIRPPVTDRTVLAFAPWMMFGSALHVLYRLDAYPDGLSVLFSTPSVYAVTAALAGAVWVIGLVVTREERRPTADRLVGIVGAALFVLFAVGTIAIRWEHGTLDPLWPGLAVVLAAIVTAIAWIGLRRWFTDVAALAGATGALVVFGHTLDGVSTAIGYDVLGAGEDVPLSRLLLETGAALPIADVVGGGWLFVLVKVALSLVIVGLFAEYIEEAPREGRTLLALIAAVGLGPGTHNVLLFLVT